MKLIATDFLCVNFRIITNKKVQNIFNLCACGKNMVQVRPGLFSIVNFIKTKVTACERQESTLGIQDRDYWKLNWKQILTFSIRWEIVLSSWFFHWFWKQWLSLDTFLSDNHSFKLSFKCPAEKPRNACDNKIILSSIDILNIVCSILIDCFFELYSRFTYVCKMQIWKKSKQ